MESSAESVDSSSDQGINRPSTRKQIKNIGGSWKNDFGWFLKTKDEYAAKCSACGISFSISNGGISDIKRHMISARHMRNIVSSQHKSVTRFLSHKSNESHQSSTTAKAAFAIGRLHQQALQADVS